MDKLRKVCDKVKGSIEKAKENEQDQEGTEQHNRENYFYWTGYKNALEEINDYLKSNN